MTEENGGGVVRFISRVPFALLGAIGLLSLASDFIQIQENLRAWLDVWNFFLTEIREAFLHVGIQISEVRIVILVVYIVFVIPIFWSLLIAYIKSADFNKDVGDTAPIKLVYGILQLLALAGSVFYAFFAEGINSLLWLLIVAVTIFIVPAMYLSFGRPSEEFRAQVRRSYYRTGELFIYGLLFVAANYALLA